MVSESQEARMNSLDLVELTPMGRNTRPLIGKTVLIVEDSRFICEAARLMCLHSGARLRRADSLAAARRHLNVYFPTIVIFDVGLPDGSGLQLISELAGASPRISVILGTSGDDLMHHQSLKAGADGFLAKPFENLSCFQSTILQLLPVEQKPKGPIVLQDAPVLPDLITFRDDLVQALISLKDYPSAKEEGFIRSFLAGVCAASGDDYMQEAIKTGDIDQLCAKIEHRIGQIAIL
jgi:two-component system OmpR family response regulator